MNISFKKLSLLTFITCFVTLLSCKKEDKDINLTSHSCIITGSSFSDDNGHSNTDYIYDENNKIIRVNTIKNDSIIVYSTVEYNSSGQISKVSNFNSDSICDSYKLYEYSIYGMLASREDYYSDFQNGPIKFQRKYTYEYDYGNRRLSRKNFFRMGSTNQIDTFIEYWWSDGNKLEKQFWRADGGYNYSQGSTKHSYDRMRNPRQILGALLSDELVSANNEIDRTIDYYTTTFTNFYNSQSFPTKIVYTDSRYNNTYTQRFTYSCQ